MPNYFTDNPDLVFHFERLQLSELVDIIEDGYRHAGEHPHAPRDYADAMENYRRVLELIGDLAGNRIAERAASVDEEGATFVDGRVRYAAGTQKNLEELAQADVSGLILPHEYGGLNFPFVIYGMAVEIVSRADASLMNIFGLQDIADSIAKFGTDEQKAAYLPGFCTGEFTGAMALTEPDAGSDLQAVKLRARQLADGTWRLSGGKRFITNGNGNVLLVLARSEEGTKDARGLSLFVCKHDETVRVRRIEHKLGIHGSPTCELQFDDTPAELVGKRKMGLIRYVLDLMYRARMGVSAQALGIAQQAYDEAHRYARERRQFNKPIAERIPAVTNMLVEMRVLLEACRTLLVRSGQAVDEKELFEKRVDQLRERGERSAEVSNRAKEAQKVAALLTPLTKYVVTEASNKIAYDALQIHGGAGYMKEFRVERLARDARITNIYEGTSQMQVVAATGGVTQDVLAPFFQAQAERAFTGALQGLADRLQEVRATFLDCLTFVQEQRDAGFQEVAAKNLVELYADCFMGYLLLDDAERSSRKAFIAHRFVLGALSRARMNAEAIRSSLYGNLLHAREILG